MAQFKAPTEDIKYLLNEFLDTAQVQSLAAFNEINAELSDAVVDEAAKISENLLFPLNRSGDEEGCHYQAGQVTTPQGFKAAYQEVVQAGWGSMSCDPEHGGQGLPHYLSNAVDEMVISSNLSFSIYIGLTIGAYRVIKQFADEDLKQQYLPAMVTGLWSGTMCLTEPHCGTDLGLIKTHAEPQDEGHYLICGSKIFISAGEQDLTENIIHLVLARTPNAPEGIKGISLFLVPKIQLNTDGSLGQSNHVSCSGIEHKMGIKASATCAMEFEKSKGYLIGDLNKGMKAMFVMMNSARLHVGVQGLAMASVSYFGAVQYAKERLQGRSLASSQATEKAAEPLIKHPDIRRMLLTMKAYTEGSRALAAWLSLELDLAEHSGDPKEKERANELVSLLTPILKAFLTDIGETVTSLGIQIYGGHGYIRENGMEQYLRDARICQIYEGANGIQALDLVGRKLPIHTGKYLRHFFHPVAAFIDEHQEDKQLSDFILPLAKSFGRLQTASLIIAQKGLANPNEAATAATEYLKLFGLVAVAFMWAKMALQASKKKGIMSDDFYDAKIKTARFYMQRLLPQTSSLLSAIASGCKNTLDTKENQF